MKRGTLINQPVSAVIAGLGHMDKLVIADAGLPIPDTAQRIDLALTQGVPTFLQTLDAVLSEMVVQQLIDEARARDLSRLMALTYVPEFFHKLGFHTVPKATLPEKVWGICVKCYKFYNCDEIAVLRYL